MPTIYTEDSAARAVEEHYYGTQGVNTGSVANNLGLAEHDRRQRASPRAGGGVSGRGRGPAQPYRRLPLFETLLDAIPRWLCLITAVAGGMLGYLFVAATPTAPALPYVAAGVGAVVGWAILPLAVVLLDFLVKVTWALLLVAFFIAAAVAMFWGISRVVN